MIKVDLLRKLYPKSVAVDGVSFDVPGNEILGFLGPNGAGKTTTLRMLVGYLPATSGSILIDDVEVTENPDKVRPLIGYMPENVVLYPELKVSEYLSFRAKIKGVSKKELKKELGRVMELCFIEDVSGKLCGTLSKGYKQRVGLADALLGSPKYIVLDEPTIGLDPNQIRRVRKLIKELKDKHTVIISSHILPEIENVADRVVILNKGRVVASGTTNNLAALMKGLSIEIEFRSENPVRLMELIKSMDEVVEASVADLGNGLIRASIRQKEDTDIREKLFNLIVENKAVLRELRTTALSLEDVFVHITTNEEVLKNA